MQLQTGFAWHLRHKAGPRTLTTPPRLDMRVKRTSSNQLLLPRAVVSGVEVAE